MAGLTNRVYVRHSDPGAPLFLISFIATISSSGSINLKTDNRRPKFKFYPGHLANRTQGTEALITFNKTTKSIAIDISSRGC